MRRNFILALIGIGIGGIGFGLVTPVTIILLEQNHAPSFIIGSTAMVGYVSIVISMDTGYLHQSYVFAFFCYSGFRKMIVPNDSLYFLARICYLTTKLI